PEGAKPLRNNQARGLRNNASLITLYSERLIGTLNFVAFMQSHHKNQNGNPGALGCRMVSNNQLVCGELASRCAGRFGRFSGKSRPLLGEDPISEVSPVLLPFRRCSVRCRSSLRYLQVLVQSGSLPST